MRIAYLKRSRTIPRNTSGKLSLIIVLFLGLYHSVNAQGSDSNGIPPSVDCPKGKWIRDKEGEYKWLCEGNIPLPVTVLSFTARNVIDNFVKLEWKVTDIVNHNHYIIQWSYDAITWQNIKETRALYTVVKTKFSDNYYRLVSVDEDGTINYYKIVYCKVLIKHEAMYNMLGQVIHEPIGNQPFISDRKKHLVKL